MGTRGDLTKAHLRPAVSARLRCGRNEEEEAGDSTGTSWTVSATGSMFPTRTLLSISRVRSPPTGPPQVGPAIAGEEQGVLGIARGLSYAGAAQVLRRKWRCLVSLLLPPNVSEQSLSKALDDFAAAVGAEHVLSSEEDRAEFRDPFWHKSWSDYEAAAVVQPATVEEIQAIVRIANERRVPLWVSAVGRNNGYGGSSPRVRGSVVVNLRRMNRVLEINEELAYAVVEPGVTLVRPLRRDPSRRPQASAVDSRPRLGQRGREHPGPRHHLPAVRPGSDDAVRDGGRPAERRADANRELGDPERPGGARLQARSRPDARPVVHAVQLRDRHEDGRVADADARVLHALLAAGLERQRPAPRRRHAARTDARQEHRGSAAGVEHALPRVGLLEPPAMVRGRGADPGRCDRPHRARARHRPVDHAFRASTATRTSSTSSSRR